MHYRWPHSALAYSLACSLTRSLTRGDTSQKRIEAYECFAHTPKTWTWIQFLFINNNFHEFISDLFRVVVIVVVVVVQCKCLHSKSHTRKRIESFLLETKMQIPSDNWRIIKVYLLFWRIFAGIFDEIFAKPQFTMNKWLSVISLVQIKKHVLNVT